MKRKIFYWAQKNLTTDKVQFFLLLIPLCVVLIDGISSGEVSVTDFLDTDILISFLLILMSSLIAKILMGIVQRQCEDSAKLSQDYKSLVDKYASEDLITYKGNRFPVMELYSCKDAVAGSFQIAIHDSPNQFYQIPGQVADHSEALMKAHDKSVIFNQLNIRLDEVQYDATTNILQLSTSRTFYFDSMVTNRACDFLLDNGKTVREIYEPGPYMRPLSKSKMSNHLGFNGFVETNDGKIPFIKRSNDLSIGKGTVADSIGASLKVKYACFSKNDYQLTESSLKAAVWQEIRDELGVDLERYVSSEDELQIFSVYRDLVECGKPQFLFYVKLSQMSSEELEAAFEKRKEERKKKAKSKQDRVLQDGNTMLFYTLDELREADITANEIKWEGEERGYVMMPSASASIVMFLRYWEVMQGKRMQGKRSKI